jgi:hypothetical protein
MGRGGAEGLLVGLPFAGVDVEDPDVWEAALELGCYGYLTKPIPESALAICRRM